MTEQFFEALHNGDINTVKILVSETPSLVNELSADNLSPFELALNSGFTKVVNYLISAQEFNVNLDGHNPLRLALDLGFIDIAKQLLDLGANPNYRPKKISSALLLCLENEYFELAELMVDKGAEVDIRNENGWTPLIWASIKGRKASVEFLIKHGANIHTCNNDGWNAVTGAYFKQHLDIVELLKEKGAVFSAKYSEAALLSAYQNSYLDIVHQLLDDGVNPDVKDEKGNTLLVLTVRKGDESTVEKLLSLGADANAISENNNPLLSVATNSDHFTICLLYTSPSPRD